MALKIAVIVPCHNEELAIGRVVADFRVVLPEATVYVYDNNSRDATRAVATDAGAVVRLEPLQGKGNVVRRMFADVEADIYVMVDGDATYHAASAPAMITRLLEENLDMVVGTRLHSDEAGAFRQGHQLGNHLLTGFVAWLFGDRFDDMLSGYRVFSRRFVKSFPAVSQGFETETEIAVHALSLRLPIAEVETPYGARPVGSVSKLHTYRDGCRILMTILNLCRSERPLAFFSLVGAILALAALMLAAPILITFLETGLVPRLPTAVLATGIILLASLSITCGLILENVTQGRRETKRLRYLELAPPSSLQGSHRGQWAEQAPGESSVIPVTRPDRVEPIGVGTRRDRAELRLAPPRGRLVLFYAAIFSALCLLVQFWTDAFEADRGLTADEAAHFVTSAMIYDYLKSHDLIHPIQFVQAYYKHFPRVAVGHWPPFFHTAQALFFFVVGPSVGGSMLFQALIAGLAAGLPAAIARHRWGRVAGIATGLMVFLSPNFLFLVNAVMIDNFSGLMVLLAALTWGRYWRARTWRSGLIFAATAIGATMTKGNALGLALLPIIHAVLSREISPFRLLKTWVIAALIGVVIVPWYVLTYKLTADGFIYHFGWDFSSHALPTYLRYFAQLVGVPALAGLALVWLSIGVQVYRSQDVTITALLAAVLAIFLFQVIAPADVQPRYLISALPAAAPLAVGGVVLVVRKLVDQLGRSAVFGDEDQGRRFRSIGRLLLTNAFLAMVILVSIGSVFRLPKTRSFRMDKIAATVVAAKAVNPLVLVCTTPNAEGAAIAAFTALERQPYHYVVRGTQALSSSQFLGNHYKTRFQSPTEFKRWLVEHKIGWLIIDTSSESRSWAHNEIAVALMSDQAGWRQISEYRQGDGAIRLYALPDQHVYPTNLESTLSTTRPSALAQF